MAAPMLQRGVRIGENGGGGVRGLPAGGTSDKSDTAVEIIHRRSRVLEIELRGARIPIRARVGAVVAAPRYKWRQF